jgi:cyanophycinase
METRFSRMLCLLLCLWFGSCSSTGNREGWLVIVGGGGTTQAIQERAIALAGGPGAKVVVFPQASELAETGPEVCEMWKERGAGSAVVGDPSQEAEALQLIAEADLIWFPGGVQTRLMDALGPNLPEAIRRRHGEGAVVGGTSAGAAVMSEVMITGEIEGSDEQDSGLNFVRSQTVETKQGLGMVDWAVVDQHFLRRRRFHRLLSCVMDHPKLVGIGVDERTAAIVQGRSIEALGEGQVLILDARDGHVETASKGKPAGGGNYRLHLLREGMPAHLVR